MIRVEGVGKSFGPVPAVVSISVTVAAGEAVGVVGPSGCGKTTLLRLVAGLEVPDAGEISLDGELVSGPGWAVEPHRRGVGFAFQAPALWPHMTVEQNLRYGMAGLPGEAVSARLDELLEKGHLAHLRKRRPNQLSMGEARRVGLLRALAPRPRRLLLDEPLTNLDAELKEEMLKLVVAEAEATGACLLYVSHIPEEVKAVTSRVLSMASGRLSGAVDS